MKRLGNFLAMLALLPLLPLYVLSFLLASASDFIDWFGEIIGVPFVWASKKIEIAFSIDPDSEYEAWKKRMRSKESSHG